MSKRTKSRQEANTIGVQSKRKMMNTIAVPSSSSLFLSHQSRPFLLPFTSSSKPGTCASIQTSADFFPSEVVVREARAEDSWEVADTHCSSFYPNYRFPIDLLLRMTRCISMLNGVVAPSGGGPMLSCLVAVRVQMKIGGLDWIFGFNRGYVAGVICIDTVAEFLPRRGPFKERRKGIAYISNVAVREEDRRKGIAKMLVSGAESLARSWGCRSLALHCDKDNVAAVRLYKSQGFRCIHIPENAQWPQPKAPPGTNFEFMMKLLV